MAAFSLVPSSYTKAAWDSYLTKTNTAGGRTDFERHAIPVLVRAVLAHLRGQGDDTNSIVQAMEAAIQSARTLRKNTRSSKSEAPIPSARSESSTPVPLGERIDGALALLERATRANHLTGKQRSRIMALAEAVDGRRGAMQPTTTRPLQSTRPTGPEPRPIDGSAGWSSSYRDHGQFGSHPGFDAMDDESSS